MMNDNSKYTGAELLRKYQEYDIKSFLYHHALLEEIEEFFYGRVDDHVMSLDIFTNDSGKWIVVKNYNNCGAITEQIIKEFCETYDVSLDRITEEVIKEFIDKYMDLSGSVLYGTEITITSSYYAFQVNGVQINKIAILDDVLVIRLINNRVAEFRILPETSIKIEKSADAISSNVSESWLMD